MTVGPIRAILVDDEVLARLSLRQALVLHPQVEIVGECGNADEALQLIGALEPDLMFLDIRMAGMDGFGLLERLEPDSLPVVVFASAFDEHALRAFDAGALDYILKPIDQERFDRCMARVIRHWQQAAAGVKGRRYAAFLPGTQYLRRLSVTMGERLKVIRVEDVDWIGAIGNYVSLHTSGGEILHRDTLMKIEAALDPAMFVRIHRSTIVNIDRIREVQPLFRGNADVVLSDGTRLLLTRRFRSRARAAFGLPK